MRPVKNRVLGLGRHEHPRDRPLAGGIGGDANGRLATLASLFEDKPLDRRADAQRDLMSSFVQLRGEEPADRAGADDRDAAMPGRTLRHVSPPRTFSCTVAPLADEGSAALAQGDDLFRGIAAQHLWR